MFSRGILFSLLLLAPLGAYAAQCPINPNTGLSDCGIRFCNPNAHGIARSACASGSGSGGGGRDRDKNFFRTDTGQIVIAAAAGAVFIGVMWYIFSTPRSDNYETQVKLASF